MLTEAILGVGPCKGNCIRVRWCRIECGMLGDKRWLMVGDPSGLSMLVVFEGSRDVGAL